jgi:type II secretory pathway pseudopilin PulG
VLLMVVLALAVMIIAMTAAAPVLKTQIKRDRETEMIHRGEQYARAIRRYYRKFTRYPTRIEELEKTNNIRFLRKRYKDPMSEEGSWRLLHLSDLMKLSPSITGAQTLGGPAQSSGGQSGGSSAFNPMSSGITNGPSQSQPYFGQQAPVATPGSSMFGGTSSGPSAFGSSGTTAQGTTSAGSSAFGAQVFGGGPLIGVASMVDRVGIHEFAGKGNYKDWLFIYDPNQDRGGLIKGPYDPNAFKGMGGGPGTSFNPGGSPLPGGMGLNGPNGLFGGTTQPQQPQPPPQPTPNP